ncbi:hypothetical protein RND81_12G225600 [Saponaria officinalis]|uniref:Sister chromatid cohesion 1 protein 3 n=1 Tax=Saponaria officinalis TaxID=3572 RepID=A0AAW1HE43_SAPOF
MFYSQTYLARKGPLGTVWCAAHLQHKLKKSHYTATDIPSTVERIIYPEVPIALRMSGHLLLGVVRIYSKKVEYLHHDCNLLLVSLRNVFRAPDVNLPAHATQANFNAVTLPETFALDALHLHDISVYDGSPDNHLRDEEEITLKEQYHDNTDLYVRITFDDDIIPDSSHSAGSLHMDTETMHIEPTVPDTFTLDIPDTVPLDIPDPGPNDNIEGFERMRDADADFRMPSPILQPHVETATLEQNKSPLADTTEKQFDTPQSMHLSASPMQPRQSPQGPGPTSSPPNGAPLESNSFVSCHLTAADQSVDLVMRPTPSPERPQPRLRKRKQFFDETLVLSNTFYKKALNDTSDIVKKKPRLPSTALEMRRFLNNKKKEQVFSDPLISGMCTSLQNLSSKELRTNLLVPEVQLEPREAQSSREPGPNFTDETELLRSPDHDLGLNFGQVFSSSTPRSPQQFRGDSGISTSPRIPSMVTEPRFASTVDTQSDPGLFTRSTDMDMDTPVMPSEGLNENLSAGLSDIPEWINSKDSDELLFLEQDDNSPQDSQGGREGETMSVRTRAVAQYLKNHSPLSKISDGPPDELSLNSILEGRHRKLCARMFYETLDRGMIDVKQDEPFGDITLKLSPAISMAKF